MPKVRLTSRLKSALALVCTFVALPSCTAPEPSEVWQMTAVAPEGLDSLHRIEQTFFVPKGRQEYQLEGFLNHDDRTEDMQMALVLRLECRDSLVRQDTLHLTLAERPGVWLGSGFLNHEVAFSLPHKLALPYAGIYRLSIYTPTSPSPKGITLVGARLK